MNPIETSNYSAISIQKLFRGYSARRDFLSKKLYPIYQAVCKNLNELTPRALEGKTRVYLPVDAEFVVKETGKETAKERFFKMKAVSSLIRSEALNHLVVPKACLYKEFLIEERLQVNTDPGYNAHLYLSNLDLFDEPIRQLTRFFSKAYIDYLVEKDFSDNSIIRIRYDNMPFILNDKEGKKSIDFGLIDLERSKIGSGIKSTAHKLFILTSMFPFHSDLIEEEMKKNSIVIEEKEKNIIQNSIVHSKEYLEKKRANYLIKNPPPKNYVTYQCSGGRFGDNLMAFLHAKWLSYKNGLPFLYRPFPFSSELVLDDTESRYDLEKEKDSQEVCFRKNLDIQPSSLDFSKIYSVRYFPESTWEKQYGTRHNGKRWVDFFSVDWKNSEFRKEVQNLIRPKENLSLIVPPENCISVALHFREGGGFDQNISDLNLPLKFPPIEFYIESLLKMIELFKGKTLYCYLFTDAKDPSLYIERIKNSLPVDANIRFDCRMNQNSHDKNVLEDFFSLFQFDTLIYPHSNFSMVPALIHDYVATCTVAANDVTSDLEAKVEINSELYKTRIEKYERLK